MLDVRFFCFSDDSMCWDVSALSSHEYALSVAPTLAPTILSAVDLAVYAGVSFLAGVVSFICPIANGAFVGFLIFVGVFIINFVEFRPITRKLSSIVWFLTLTSHFSAGYVNWQTVLTISGQLLISLALGLCASLCAQMTPIPITSTSTVKRSVSNVCTSLAASCHMLGKLGQVRFFS